MRILSIITCLILLFTIAEAQEKTLHRGYFDFEYDESKGSIILNVKKDQLNSDFLYVASLSAGVGSNDIGLDRGQLGPRRLVRFEKHGNKLLLIERNMYYRAISENAKEKQAVKEAFAESVIQGFPIMAFEENQYKIDLNTLLLRDEHQVANRLMEREQGEYNIDPNGCAIYMDRTKNFPKNTEFEAILTFVGKPMHEYISSVTTKSKSHYSKTTSFIY